MSEEKSKKKEKKKSRQFLYLDTNILWSFSISFNHPLLQILLEVARLWGFKVAIPEVAYLEWLQKKKEDIENDLKRIETSIINLKEKYLFEEIELENVTAPKILEHAKTILDQNLKDRDITILETGEIELDRLINMSILKVKPFEKKGEKGFRDSVILFSILNHSKGLNKDCWFITNDKVFISDDVTKIAEERGIKLVIFESIQEFKETFEKIKLKIIKEVRKERLAKLKDFLMSKKGDIEEFVKKEAKFDLTALNMFIKSQFPDYTEVLRTIHSPPRRTTTSNITKLNGIELLDITAPSLPIETDKEVVPVYFNVKLKLVVTVEKVFAPVFEERININGIESSYSERSATGQITFEEIEAVFPVYGAFKIKEGEYTELALTHIGTSYPPSFLEVASEPPKK